MVAKAELGIVITDSGPPPVGAPAPEVVRYPGVSPNTGGDGATAGTAADASASAFLRESIDRLNKSIDNLAGSIGKPEVGAKPTQEPAKPQAPPQPSPHRPAPQRPEAQSPRQPEPRTNVESAAETAKAPPKAKQESPFLTGKDGAVSPATNGFPAPPPLPNSAGAPAGGAAEAVEGTAALGASAATAAAAIAGVAIAAGLATKALHDQAAGLAKFSPEVAGANAQNELRELLTEMRRAQRIGPELADFENQRSRVQETLSDLWTEILKVLLSIWKLLSPFIEFLNGAIKVLIAFGKPIVDGIEAIADAATGHLPSAAKAIDQMGMDLKAIPGAIANAVGGNEDPLTNPFTTGFMAMGRPNVNDVRNAPPIAQPVGF